MQDEEEDWEREEDEFDDLENGEKGMRPAREHNSDHHTKESKKAEPRMSTWSMDYRHLLRSIRIRHVSRSMWPGNFYIDSSILACIDWQTSRVSDQTFWINTLASFLIL